MLIVIKNLVTLGICLFTAIVASSIAYFVIWGKEKAECRINPFEVNLHPIIVHSGATYFIYPRHGEKYLFFKPGQSLDFICPGRKVIMAKSPTNESVLSGTCVTKSIFKIGKKKVDWKDLRCSTTPWRTIKYTGRDCENDGKEIEVGFHIATNRFLRSMLICFNQELQIAYYTYINQTASINRRDQKTPRPAFQQGEGIYDIGTVNNLYVRKNQRATVNKLLGLPVNSTKYIKDTTNLFLARGHLTAKADQFYGAQQNATFFYQNVAPQWQSFNGYNWKRIEIDVRNYAENNAVDLHVWTGVHGVTTLPHEDTGQPIKLYLYVNETTSRKALPVPEIYWKVVHNPKTQRGIALIGVNNPYKSTLPFTICSDISKKLSWLHCDRNSQQHGFCYACSVGTFRKVVDSMPYIPVRGILL